jgi:alpha-1,2-mannosyltransferase
VSSVLARPGVAATGGRVRGKRILLVGAVAFALVLASYVFYVAIHPESYTLYPVDLDVYRDGGLIARHLSPPYDPSLGSPLYDWPASNTALNFTYTPFAALFFAMVSFIPWSVLPRLSVVVNIAALVAAIWFTVGALDYRGRVRLGATLLGSAAVFWIEPVMRTLYLGQINLLLMALIIWDLTQPDTDKSRRWKGAVTGFAAGVKLVPLIFIPYLLLTRKFRQAAMACGAFVCTVILGFLILPRDSIDWWFHTLFIQDGRTGFVGWGGNQSLRGLLTRFAGSMNAATAPWVVISVLVVVLGLVAAAMIERAGHRMLGLLMVALTGLLVSPISWDHHWVWIAPGVVVAGHYAVRAWQAGDKRAAWACGALGVGLLLLFAPWPGFLWHRAITGAGSFTFGLIWAAPNSPVTLYMTGGDQPYFQEYHWRFLQLAAGNAYILGGLALFALLVITAVRVGGRDGVLAVVQPGHDEPSFAI